MKCEYQIIYKLIILCECNDRNGLNINPQCIYLNNENECKYVKNI